MKVCWIREFDGKGITIKMEIYFVLYCCLVLRSVTTAKNKAIEPPRVISLHVTSEIQYRFASTLISSQLSNDGARPTQAVYDVIVPAEAFVSNFSIDVNGKMVTGTVKEREMVKGRFTDSRGYFRSGARVIQAKPRDTNVFHVEVTVAPHSTVTFHLTYQEVLERRLGSYKHVIHLNPGQHVPDLKIDVTIRESRHLTLLRVLPIKTVNLVTDFDITDSDDSLVTRPSGRTASIHYSPSLESQQEHGVGGPFTVEYDIVRNKDAGDVLVVNGYFVHFFAPKIANPVPKDILFILDTSSSMTPGKMLQLKTAMGEILTDLRVGDRFNILEFNTDAILWQEDRMLEVSGQNVQSAVEYIANLTATGATNINDALVNGVDFMNRFAHEKRSLIVFLTDGQASTGLTSNYHILSNVRSRNIYDMPIYSLAFGLDADWSFVKTVAIQNNGVGRKISDESDAASQITGFYHEISTPILSDVKFNYLEQATNESTVTRSAFKNVFNGSEVVVAGQLAEEDAGVISLVVSGKNSGNDLDLKLKARTDELRPADEPARPKEVLPFEDVTEKMWAYLKIKDLLRRRDGEMEPEERERLRKEAVDLAVKYNYVTPVTSMVIVQYTDATSREQFLEDQPPSTDDVKIHHGGWNARGGRDPHFLVKTLWLDDQLCFDVTGQPKDVYQVIKDPVNDITINIMLKSGHLKDSHGHKRTYIFKVAMLLKKHTIIANQDGVVINNRKYNWTGEILHRVPPGVAISQHNKQSVTIRLKGGFSLTIFKHVPSRKHGGDVFLNIELDREGKLSRNTTGLLGQFIHKKLTMKKMEEVSNRTVAHLQVAGHTGPVKGLADLQTRMDPVTKTRTRCWLLHSGGRGIFAVPQKHFLKKTLTSH